MATAGKNKRRQLTIYDSAHNVELSVDSAEEVDSIEWLLESKSLGIINDFTYQPPPFVLFDGAKYQDVTNKTKTLFQGHLYTPDFSLDFTPSSQLELAKEFKVPYTALSSDNYTVYIDSKGTFNRTERSFSYNQKWVWQIFKIYIYKLVPSKFFKKFGCPIKSFYTAKTKKTRNMFKGFKSIKDIFIKNKN